MSIILCGSIYNKNIEMNKLIQLINEEIHFLKEDEYDDVDWDLYEARDRVEELIFEDFLYRNNEDFTKHAPWTVIPFTILKKLWEDYMKYGYVRYPKQLDKIEGIFTRNILKIDLFTFYSGHTNANSDYDFEEHMGNYVDGYLGCYYKNNPEYEYHSDFKKIYTSGNCENYKNRRLDEEMEKIDLEDVEYNEIREIILETLKEAFWDYYIEDPKEGQARISDYGLKPLFKLLEKLRKEKSPEKKLVIMDNMLNVIHMRSDIASWFLQGGSSALSQLSGTITPEEFNQREV
jgi:hypothetical protein